MQKRKEFFSILNDTKTKKQYKMGPELFNAILVTKLAVKGKGEDYRNKEIITEHFDIYNVSMCTFKNVVDK